MACGVGCLCGFFFYFLFVFYNEGCSSPLGPTNFNGPRGSQVIPTWHHCRSAVSNPQPPKTNCSHRPIELPLEVGCLCG